jgi:hypothetical protein
MMDAAARLDALQRRVERLAQPVDAAERDALALAQSRADSAYAHAGQAVSPPVPGESSLTYRRRLLAPMLSQSDQFKGADARSLDATTIGPIEELVYADAIAAAKRPENYLPGELRPVTTHEFGRDVTRFYGDISAWMDAFTTPGASVRINRDESK